MPAGIDGPPTADGKGRKNKAFFFSEVELGGIPYFDPL
jgi:hypothetical protein